jgi:hypothetical protein
VEGQKKNVWTNPDICQILQGVASAEAEIACITDEIYYGSVDIVTGHPSATAPFALHIAAVSAPLQKVAALDSLSPVQLRLLVLSHAWHQPLELRYGGAHNFLHPHPSPPLPNPCSDATVEAARALESNFQKFFEAIKAAADRAELAKANRDDFYAALTAKDRALQALYRTTVEQVHAALSNNIDTVERERAVEQMSPLMGNVFPFPAKSAGRPR